MYCSIPRATYDSNVCYMCYLTCVAAEPELQCPQYEFLAKPGDTTHMSCEVKSNPEGNIFFRFKNRNTSVENVVRVDAFGAFTELGYNFEANVSCFFLYFNCN